LTNLNVTVWFVCGGPGSIGTVDPASSKLWVAKYSVTVAPNGGIASSGGTLVSPYGAVISGTGGIAAAGGDLWILNNGNTVTEFDPTTRTAVQTVPGLNNPGGIAAGGNSVWITNFDAGTVSRLALTGPGLPPTITTIPVDRGPAPIAYGGDAVWVANTTDRTISRIDPKKNKVTATINVGSVPAAIAFGAGRLWVTTLSPPPKYG
jgi:YVTN family beta-propeller protein